MSIILFVIEREGGLREREGVSAGEGFFFVKVMSFITYLLSNSSTVTSCVVESFKNATIRTWVPSDVLCTSDIARVTLTRAMYVTQK